MTAFNWARDVFDLHPAERAALLWVDDAGAERRLAYGHFAEASRRCALALAARGVRPGQTVLLLLPRVPAWWEALLACLRGGHVAAPGTVQLTACDLAFRLPACEAVAVVTDANNAPKVDEAERLAGVRLACKLLTDGARAGWERYADALAAVPAGVGRGAYRIVQEGLTNA
ncbi:MAG TPA: AMP-binding protein, partial [Planctomycetota bacterium]|nr:AMP-binding protein [Planctomycetota bacterium]